MRGLSHSSPFSIDPTPERKRRRISGISGASHYGFWILCAAFAFFGLFTTNGLLTSCAFLLLPVFGVLLWRVGEPPVLFFGCIIQWLQATAAIFYTNHFGITLNEAFGSYALTFATWLSLISVLVLAIGIRCAYIGAGPPQAVALQADASQIDINTLAVIYGLSVVVAGSLGAVAWLVPSITQPLLALAALKWAIVFLLFYAVLQQRKGYGFLVAAISFEFLMGLTGVYANFKSVFFVLAVAAMSSPLALKGRRLWASIICFILLFVFSVVWTTVKMDYRSFLADESMYAEDAIPIERKFDKLTDLVGSVTWENFTDGIDALVMRVSYVNFFALTIENVPARVPYEGGALWGDAVVRVITPRFLFPNKATTDDSERTRLYTGVQVSGAEEGTSIGIGYVGESYIDFGPVGMFVPIFLLGLFYGLLNRFFITRTRHKLLGAALAVSALIFSAYEIETSNIKLVGGVLSVALVSIVMYKAFGRMLMATLGRPKSALPWRRSQVAVIPV